MAVSRPCRDCLMFLWYHAPDEDLPMNTNNPQPYTSFFDKVIMIFVGVSMMVFLGYANLRDEATQKKIAYDKAEYAASVAATLARYAATEPIRNLAESRVNETLRVHEVAYHATVQHIVSLACGSAATLVYEVHNDRSGHVRCGSSVTHVITFERNLAKMPEEPFYENEMRRYEKFHPSEVDAIEMEKPLT